MFKNLDKNGSEKARLGTLRAQRSALSSVAIPDGCAALAALYPSYSSGIGLGIGLGTGSGIGSGTGLGDFGALRALVDALGQGVTQLVLTAKQTGASLCVTRLAECEGVRVRKVLRWKFCARLLGHVHLRPKVDTKKILGGGIVGEFLRAYGGRGWRGCAHGPTPR